MHGYASMRNHPCAHTQTHTHKHARTHAHTHAHTHTQASSCLSQDGQLCCYTGLLLHQVRCLGAKDGKSRSVKLKEECTTPTTSGLDTLKRFPKGTLQLAGRFSRLPFLLYCSGFTNCTHDYRLVYFTNDSMATFCPDIPEASQSSRQRYLQGTCNGPASLPHGTCKASARHPQGTRQAPAITETITMTPHPSPPNAFQIPYI